MYQSLRDSKALEGIFRKHQKQNATKKTPINFSYEFIRALKLIPHKWLSGPDIPERSDMVPLNIDDVVQNVSYDVNTVGSMRQSCIWFESDGQFLSKMGWGGWRD